MKNFIRLGTIAILIASLFCFYQPVAAAASLPAEGGEGSACYALDVIFIVDQSQSMSYENDPTDPTGQRETAVEAMIDWLAENALDRCPDVRHQVGVISFGSEVRVDLPLTELAPDSFRELQTLENNLHEEVIADDMGTTQPLEAFEAAKEMFDQYTYSSDAPRKRVIIFLTDGLIDDGNGNDGRGYINPTIDLQNWVNQNLPFDSTLLEREECINFEVESYGSFDAVPYEELNSCLQDHDVPASSYSASTYVYMVLMNFGQGWPKDVRDVYRDITTRHGGELMDFYEQGGENRNEIPEYFQTIMAKMVGVPSGKVDCGPVAVNPYLDRITFVFYKFSEDTRVTLRYVDADGVTHSITNGQTTETGGFTLAEPEQLNGTNERYIFTKPYPGIWFIESDRCANGGVSAFYKEVQVNPGGYTLPFTEIPQYDLEPYYDESEPFYLTYQMRDMAGNVIDNSEHPFFTAQVQAEVNGPDGSGIDDTYTLEWVDADNLFRATEPLKVPVSGTYTVDIVGSTLVHTGETTGISEVLSTTFSTSRELFRHENLEFEVRSVLPFVVNVDTPKADQTINQIHGTILEGWPLIVKPVQIKAYLTWRDNQPLDVPITQILENPNNAFTAWVEFPDGTTSEKIQLHLDPSAPEYFVGEIPGIDSISPLILHVELTGTINSDYRADSRHKRVSFARQDGLAIFKPEFYKVLIWIIVIGLFVLTGYQFWNHYDPVDGEITLIMNNEKVYSATVWSTKRITSLPRKDIRAYDLKKLRVRYAPYVRDQEDENTARDVIFTGKTDCGQNISFQLPVDGESGYCAIHTDFGIKYENTTGSRKPFLKTGPYMLLPLLPVVLIIVFFLM